MTRVNLRKEETNYLAFEFTRGYLLIGPSTCISIMLDQLFTEQFDQVCHYCRDWICSNTIVSSAAYTFMLE